MLPARDSLCGKAACCTHETRYKGKGLKKKGVAAIRSVVFPWCYWEVHPSCQRQRGSSSDTLKLQEKINGPKFKARAAHCSSSCLQLLDIPNAPQRTFPALPAARLPSPSASATERPPPAFGSASTGLAPDKRQQLGHLRDTSGEERWCNGGGLFPAASRALISPGAGSQDRSQGR